MPSIVFLEPKLVGARFDGHEIPLDVMGDFSVLEEFVKEVAKWHFRAQNPGRERSPRGFLSDASLKLSAVEEGSAIPVIVLSLASAAQMLFAPSQLYLEQSRDSIMSAVSAAQRGQAPTDHLPENLLGYFEKFGKSLRDGESIEFSHKNEIVKLTKDTRRRLLAASQSDSQTDTLAVIATIPEADQSKETFEIHVDGKRFVSKEFARHRDNVIQAFTGYKNGVKVRVRGVFKIDKYGDIYELQKLESVDILDPLDVTQRLEELVQLNEGWLDGEGTRFSVDGVYWLAAAFEVYYDVRLVLPHLYPMLNGGVRAEWAIGKIDASLEVDLENRKGEWHQLDLATDAEESKSLDLSKREDWEWAVVRIGELGGVRND
jgi:hypothetical protein